MVKKAKTAEQNQKELEELTERIFTQFQPILGAKGYELVRYLDGEVDQQTSDTVRDVMKKAAEKAEKELMKGKWTHEPDLEKMMKKVNVYVIWMHDGETIPDWVVKTKATYEVLIEIVKGVIEINSPDVAQEMADLAQKWEDERKVFASDPAFDHEHFGCMFEEEVSIVKKY